MNGVTTEWSGYTGPPTATKQSNVGVELNRVNDPSAGSPTETLLRLLLPLSNKVHLISSTSAPANRHARLSKIFTGLLNR